MDGNLDSNKPTSYNPFVVIIYVIAFFGLFSLSNS
jgi:hypothetical protein